MPKPKKGAKDWSLNVRKVPIDLYWMFHNAALKEQKEFGQWALEVLKKAAHEVLGTKPNKTGKTGV